MASLKEMTRKGKQYWESSLYFLGYQTESYDYISYDNLVACDNYDFLKYIIQNADRYELNHVVSKFSAYEVAINCYETGYMTTKQRAALTNVYLFYQFDTLRKWFFDNYI
jgi:hypothetical protein